MNAQYNSVTNLHQSILNFWHHLESIYFENMRVSVVTEDFFVSCEICFVSRFFSLYFWCWSPSPRLRREEPRPVWGGEDAMGVAGAPREEARATTQRTPAWTASAGGQAGGPASASAISGLLELGLGWGLVFELRLYKKVYIGSRKPLHFLSDHFIKVRSLSSGLWSGRNFCEGIRQNIIYTTKSYWPFINMYVISA